MELVGKAIKHVTFGRGVITNRTDNILTVDFAGNHKKFLFPGCLLSFYFYNGRRRTSLCRQDFR